MAEPLEVSALLKNHESFEDINEFRQSLRKCFEAICASNSSVLLEFGSNLLTEFVQLNWTGPKNEGNSLLSTLPDHTKKEWNDSCLKDEYDGEVYGSKTWYELVISPYLLSCAYIILVENMTEGFDSLLWAMRCLSIQQQVLSEKSSTIWNQLQNIIERLVIVMDSQQQIHRDKLCSTHLEIFNCLLFHSQYDEAIKHLKIAESFADIDLELTGALGKRTKFQQFDTAQLLLKVSQGKDGNNTDEDTTGLPTDVSLDDDTLLGHVKFADNQQANFTSNMSSIQQAVVLNKCIHHKWTNPVHRLTTEQMEAYLDTLLGQPKCWVIQTMALYLRSLFERTRSRAMERSMMQLQEIVNLYSKPQPSGSQRIAQFYCVPLPPHWIIEKEFADTLVKLGANQSALDIYERLHLWDDVISCYQNVGRRGQAERVIRKRMAVEGESVKLWCLLGDASKDHTCYEKAWVLSNSRSSRAQKSLGLYYLSKEKFEECADSLQKSVSINPLQAGLWFTLGHAANKIDNHSLAAQAYRQCVTLESDNFEAWNNLAGEYIKLKDKIRAFNAFQEALKCNYENWKIWDNYLIVSIDIGEFEEGIRAYHRILDTQKKHLDTEVLNYMTNAVIKNTTMRNGNDACELRKKVGELLARAVAQTTGSSELWEICSKLHLSSEDAVDIDKGLIELQKAQRTARHSLGWETDDDKRERVVDLTIRYSKACRNHAGKDANQILSSSRLCVQAVITKLKDAMELDTKDKTVYEDLVEALKNELTTLSSS